MRIVFSTTVGAENFNWAAHFFFNKCFIILKSHKSIRFFKQKINPSFSTEIINESNYILFTSI
ncbi:hypothetical protein LguiB_012319 [Lonicera macranthoides]